MRKGKRGAAAYVQVRTVKHQSVNLNVNNRSIKGIIRCPMLKKTEVTGLISRP
jgi:hypothetical protein